MFNIKLVDLAYSTTFCFLSQTSFLSWPTTLNQQTKTAPNHGKGATKKMLHGNYQPQEFELSDNPYQFLRRTNDRKQLLKFSSELTANWFIAFSNNASFSATVDGKCWHSNDTAKCIKIVELYDVLRFVNKTAVITGLFGFISLTFGHLKQTDLS